MCADKTGIEKKSLSNKFTQKLEIKKYIFKNVGNQLLVPIDVHISVKHVNGKFW